MIKEKQDPLYWPPYFSYVSKNGPTTFLCLPNGKKTETKHLNHSYFVKSWLAIHFKNLIKKEKLLKLFREFEHIFKHGDAFVLETQPYDTFKVDSFPLSAHLLLSPGVYLRASQAKGHGRENTGWPKEMTQELSINYSSAYQTAQAFSVHSRRFPGLKLSKKWGT